MTQSQSIFGSQRRYQLFTAVKYVTYLLLSINVALFLREELAALEHTFADGIAASQFIQAFASTIDTGAWVLLLLLFELETSVLDDSRIHGPVKWALHGIRGLCYIAIVYAFTGYYAELITLYQTVPMPQFDACTAQGWSLLVDLDDYVPLGIDNCAALGADLHRISSFDIVAPADTLRSARYLAWTDVINAATWILVVVMLEVEVRLQLRGNLSDQIMGVTKFIKFGLYFILFAAAAYWGYAGSFLDFWDAALWLFAFIFIELNVFEWQHETTREAGLAA